ncbi:MAG: hypothetical protein ACXWM7_01165 [Parachlamydiaceae bacterium]
MKLTTVITILMCLIGALSFSPSTLDAYGYQPDSEGYAYTQSTTSLSNSNIIPIAAVATAVVIGVILYTGHHRNHHHGHSH